LIIAFASGFDEKNANFLKEFHKAALNISNPSNCETENTGKCTMNTNEKVGFGYSTGKEVSFLLQKVQMSVFDFPSILIISKKTGKHVVLDKSKFDIYSEQSILNFWDDFKSGKLVSFLKSEDEPTDNETNPLKTITLNNFEKIVLSKKSVLVYFWKSMCPHCVALSPIYDEIAKDYQNSETIQIGKMNVEKNALPSFVKVDFLPTLLFFPNCNETEKEKYIEYRGNREFQDIRDFITKNKC
jgi:thioredoxin 1